MARSHNRLLYPHRNVLRRLDHALANFFGSLNPWSDRRDDSDEYAMVRLQVGANDLQVDYACLRKKTSSSGSSHFAKENDCGSALHQKSPVELGSGQSPRSSEWGELTKWGFQSAWPDCKGASFFRLSKAMRGAPRRFFLNSTTQD